MQSVSLVVRADFKPERAIVMLEESKPLTLKSLKENDMQELTFEQVEDVNGGARIRGILDAVGYTSLFMEAKTLLEGAGSSFYENVMISNRWIDDLNWTAGK